MQRMKILQSEKKDKMKTSFHTRVIRQIKPDDYLQSLKKDNIIDMCISLTEIIIAGANRLAFYLGELNHKCKFCDIKI